MEIKIKVEEECFCNNGEIWGTNEKCPVCNGTYLQLTELGKQIIRMLERRYPILRKSSAK